jgi:membrane fusion protein, heavy metal efflux system
LSKKLQLLAPLAIAILCFSSCGKSGKQAAGGGGDASSGGAGQQKEGQSQPNQAQLNQTKSGQNNLVHITAEAQRTANMQILPVEVRPVPETLNVAGQIMPNEEHTAHIGSYVSGRVLEVSANVGDRVHRGDVLARMHSHEVHETLAAYRTAQEEVLRQETALEFATRNRDRMERLYGLKFASKQEVERAEVDLSAQQTNLANAKISLQRESAHLSDILRVPEQQLSKMDESRDEVPVIASISGIVTARMISPGAVVEPGQEVYTLTDLRTVWMMASVFEPDIAKVRVGAKATVKTQAYPEKEFPGRVTRIGAELDPKTRTLQVRLLVPNPREELRAAMFANAELDQGSMRSAVFVPEEALQEVNGGTVVFVRRSPEEFEVRPVNLGSRANGEAAIRSGLKPGEEVIVRSSFLAKSELLKSQIGE